MDLNLDHMDHCTKVSMLRAELLPVADSAHQRCGEKIVAKQQHEIAVSARIVSALDCMREPQRFLLLRECQLGLSVIPAEALLQFVPVLPTTTVISRIPARTRLSSG